MKQIRKIGAIILNPERDKMIVVRKRGKDVFIIPGGRPEGDESDLETLARELEEELCVTLTKSTFFGEYREPAEFGEGDLVMRVYDVEVSGDLSVANEIEEATWIDSKFGENGIKIGSTLRNHVVPALMDRGDL